MLFQQLMETWFIKPMEGVGKQPSWEHDCHTSPNLSSISSIHLKIKGWAHLHKPVIPVPIGWRQEDPRARLLAGVGESAKLRFNGRPCLINEVMCGWGRHPASASSLHEWCISCFSVAAIKSVTKALKGEVFCFVLFYFTIQEIYELVKAGKHGSGW